MSDISITSNSASSYRDGRNALLATGLQAPHKGHHTGQAPSGLGILPSAAGSAPLGFQLNLSCN